MKVYPALNKVRDLTITGSLIHQGTTVGLYNTTPATQTTGIAQLTDNTAGTANDTLQAMADVGVDLLVAASQSDVNNRLVSIRNNFADLAAKLNAVMTALKNKGDFSA